MASSADTGTYLLIVTIGFVLTVIVGLILMRSGRAFLSEVFDGEGVAESVTRLLAMGFFLVALGILAAFSTWDPIPVDNVAQLIVTKVGGVLLVLGIMHATTLYALARVRNNRRVQAMAANLRSGGRRPARDGQDSTKGIGPG